MRKYVVTRKTYSLSVVYADSEEDAEDDAIKNGDFKFVDEEFSVEEVC